MIMPSMEMMETATILLASHVSQHNVGIGIMSQ